LPSHLPKELLDSLAGVKGFDASAFEQVHGNGQQVVSVRMNPMKWPAPAGTGEHAEQASVSGAKADEPVAWRGKIGGGDAGRIERVPWSSHGYYLERRPSFTFDPLFHAGTYYVQEASSMFLEQALRQTTDLEQPLRVLDLCAAPGGKSTLIQSLISRESLLVSNEVIRARAGVLRENMVKWGGANMVITGNDPHDFQRMENYFDVIVVDAPCSGSGLFRREPAAIAEWSPENVRLCSGRQQRILADCWPALRQGGILIYSTCSYSVEEDEDILGWIAEELQATSCRLQLDESWNIVETNAKNGAYGYRLYPDRLQGEGFFIAALRKEDGGEFSYPKGMKDQAGHRKHSSGKGAHTSAHSTHTAGNRAHAGKLTRQEEGLVQDWTREDRPLIYFKHNDDVHGLPAHLEEDLSFLQSCCYLKMAGVPMGKLMAKEFVPGHELALSVIINAGLPVIDLSREEAIQYLRKEQISAGGAHRGWALARYEGHNLGWVKVLAGRVNNYYPRDWRILKRD